VKAELDFDFYLATKHRFVHDAYVIRGLSRNPDRSTAARVLLRT
jgi:hypothetical protein